MAGSRGTIGVQGDDVLVRDVTGATRRRYDLVVVGGGIAGACVLLEAARRGLRGVLLERGDFGGGTSANSLRILHGGLRYLQTLDLPRVRRSVAERRWFARHFPELVRPLPCLLPLYGEGLKRPAPMAAALALNDLLSWRRNLGVPQEARLPRGRLLPAAEVRALVRDLPDQGLRGGALWYDLMMPSSERVLVEILRWAAGLGSVALNYVAAEGLRTRDGAVTGVEATDAATGETLLFGAPVVVNCAGPWGADVADALGSPAGRLGPRALAFNVLLDRPPPASVAVAVRAGPEGRTYFLLPWKGRLLAGTEHVPWSRGAEGGADGGKDPTVPAPDRVEAMLTALGAALPSLRGVGIEDVVRVYGGLMPVDAEGDAEPASRDRLINHARAGGPAGLHSAVGVKYTTARHLAERVLRRIHGRRPPLAGTGRPRAGRPVPRSDWRIVEREEAVMHLDDLLLRRMDWPADAPPADVALAELARRRGWDAERRDAELERVRAAAAPLSERPEAVA